MTNEEAKKAEKELNALLNMCNPSPLTKELEDALNMAIKALEAQTCIEDYPTCTECEHYDSEKHYCPRFCQVIKDTLAEAQPTDAVSREAVLMEIDKYLCGVPYEKGIDKVIKALPSVTPQRPKGKWIDVNGDKSLFECSKCGDKVCCANNNYCPNCGEKMEGGEDGEDSAFD